MRLLLVGQDPKGQTPLHTLSLALGRLGARVEFSLGKERGDWSRWAAAVLRCDCVILVSYGGPDLGLVRQLALAPLLGRPLVRWWVGSDVLNCTQDDVYRRPARILNEIVARNIGVAPHLVTELAEIGIAAEFIPSMMNPDWVTPSHLTGPARKTVLGYLPTENADFYGEAIFARAIQDNPDLTFIIVGDRNHRFATYPNVRSLGWIEDMKPIYDQADVLLRVTRHDGLPRMVMEALLRGLNVIYAWPLPGCHQAKTPAEVQACLDEYKSAQVDNVVGRDAMLDLLHPDPAVRYLDLLEETTRKSRYAHQVRAAVLLAGLVPAQVLQYLRRKLSARRPTVVAKENLVASS